MTIEELIKRIQELEQRVAALEKTPTSKVVTDYSSKQVKQWVAVDTARRRDNNG